VQVNKNGFCLIRQKKSIFDEGKCTGGNWDVTCSKIISRPLLDAFSNTHWDVFSVNPRQIVSVNGKTGVTLYQNSIRNYIISLVDIFLSNILPMISMQLVKTNSWLLVS